MARFLKMRRLSLECYKWLKQTLWVGEHILEASYRRDKKVVYIWQDIFQCLSLWSHICYLYRIYATEEAARLTNNDSV